MWPKSISIAPLLLPGSSSAPVSPPHLNTASDSHVAGWERLVKGAQGWETLQGTQIDWEWVPAGSDSALGSPAPPLISV